MVKHIEFRLTDAECLMDGAIIAGPHHKIDITGQLWYLSDLDWVDYNGRGNVYEHLIETASYKNAKRKLKLTNYGT